MKKIILLFIIITSLLFGWEVTTHRAIDKTVIESSEVKNLDNFVNNSGLKKVGYTNEVFEGYKNIKTSNPISYFDYFDDDYSDDAMADWNQTFAKNHNYQDLIEAGSMLEDALWPDADWIAFGGDGRFNNHFYEYQNYGKGLTWGYGLRDNAVTWATSYFYRPTIQPFKYTTRNQYDYSDAMEYFRRGFAESNETERHKFQAKMFVSVGCMMHLVNDMNRAIL